ALLARGFVGSDDFLLTFGDILTGASVYRAILDQLRLEPAASASIGVKQVDDPYQGAAVYAGPDGGVTRIIEKPPRGASTTRWNSAGVYAFRSSIFDYVETTPLSPRGEYELTGAVAQLIEQGKLARLFPIEGGWRDIGRPEDLE